MTVMGIGLPPQGTAQSPLAAVLRGWVVDTAGRPVGGAQLHLVGTEHRATSAENGTFRLEGLPPGRHTLLTRAIGYRPNQQSVLVERLEDTLRVVLVPVPRQLDDIVVTPEDEVYQARLRDFALRTGSIRGGRVFRVEEIERRGRHGLGNLLAHHFEVGPVAFNTPGGFTNSRVLSDCAPGLAVNGGNLEIGVPITRFKAEDIEAIEAYPRGSPIPPQYRHPSTRCGLVIIWLKDYVPPGFGERRARR